ncbi:MAG TPA: aminomethyl-transferring glycine dehydrogenase subunit GcvPA [Aggregatilineales bacterium]|nr:aminomethyl-transferring glycine dehydrogenase subunit GcvPA [Chloroflexota bacterium]HOA22720.1 aminomethyl-transferring glycine dehydrogenase subunit GcvPA [Aggregatilineales bacterium]HPV08416.1 aminomethyl-transferring glycine dehydrogenase subunit GcvPA [Aggregatilineales bacterium]HQA68545.1 aminomethyl-transferring glycine dehydrogenase subunit GcvPA [Aggregatilineales bacterium]HQE19645.1 aminomethyl-transferring glycine dehydrogenase subunit GcvPA [Aggregatilineales bacterium]
MSYLPHTEADVKAMLEAIGVERVEDLFQDVPESVRFPELDLPAALSQMEVAWLLENMSDENLPGGKTAIFLGAGTYNHYIPPVVGHIIQRGEFLTAYTPYQPEVSQGTLQAIFEYQSMITQLTGMEVSNASHYDGATSLAEAAIMSYSHFRGKRSKLVLCSGIHPEYRDVVRTYMQGMDVEIVGDESCWVDMDKLVEHIDDNTAMVAVAYPNFFGEVDPIEKAIQAAHEHGALAVVVADPISLGLLKPPGWMGADIVVGEGQGLGIPMSFGGPFLGIFATREAYVRKMAGRLVGETKDKDGKTGYVLTLATREQHIRREKATSNICTNQGLMALSAAIYLSVMGKHGLRQVAELCYHKSHYAADEIAKLDGYKVFRDKPFVKEFVVECPLPVEEINAYLLENYSIIGGYDLSKRYPERERQMLIAVTEMNTRDEIDTLVRALAEVAE